MRIDPNSKHPAKTGRASTHKAFPQTTKAHHLALSHDFGASFKGRNFDADWTRKMKPTSTACKVAKLWSPQVHAHATLRAGSVTRISL